MLGGKVGVVAQEWNKRENVSYGLLSNTHVPSLICKFQDFESNLSQGHEIHIIFMPVVACGMKKKSLP